MSGLKTNNPNKMSQELKKEWEYNKVYLGGCLEVMKEIPDKSIDMILCDPPYGNIKKAPTGWNIEKLQWDNIINPQEYFNLANKILRKNGIMILFSQEPYTTNLINSQTKDIQFCYRAIWEKDNFANALGVNKNMVGFYEDILVFKKHFESENNDDNPCKEYAVRVFNFINKPMKDLISKYGNTNLTHFYSSGKQFRLCTEETYNKLIQDFSINNMQGFKTFLELKEMNRQYKNSFLSTFNLWEGKKYKSNILKYSKDYEGLHPTQKPVLLFEDLIKTFSNEGDLVLDNCAGSGTTGVACKNTNRNFILIEKEQEYIDIINKRLSSPSRTEDLTEK